MVSGVKNGPVAQSQAPRSRANIKPPEGDSPRHTIEKGDTLAKLAKKYLGDAKRWPELAKLNAEYIHDPTMVRPGDVVLLPEQVQETAPAQTAIKDTDAIDKRGRSLEADVAKNLEKKETGHAGVQKNQFLNFLTSDKDKLPTNTAKADSQDVKQTPKNPIGENTAEINSAVQPEAVSNGLTAEQEKAVGKLKESLHVLGNSFEKRASKKDYSLFVEQGHAMKRFAENDPQVCQAALNSKEGAFLGEFLSAEQLTSVKGLATGGTDRACAELRIAQGNGFDGTSEKQIFKGLQNALDNGASKRLESRYNAMYPERALRDDLKSELFGVGRSAVNAGAEALNWFTKNIGLESLAVDEMRASPDYERAMALLDGNQLRADSAQLRKEMMLGTQRSVDKFYAKFTKDQINVIKADYRTFYDRDPDGEYRNLAGKNDTSKTE